VNNENEIREKIFDLVREIFEIRRSKEKFIPIKDKVQYAGAVYDHDEVIEMFNAILDGWFGIGKYVLRFEREFAKFLGVKKTIMTNSGSSANLISIASLMSYQLGDSRLKPGDEVITPALTFPTTLNPIIQHDLVPVFVDIELGTYNINPEHLEKALSEKTRAIFIPHTLGNPNEMDTIMDFVEDNDLYLIEDACDALGSKYDGKYLGTFDDFATFSFYPAHHITTGEGGMVVTNNETLARIAQSLRDWGRACVMPYCNPLKCGDRECPKANPEATSLFGELPDDYDKRYTYIEIGYNLKPIEVQGAMGLAQLRKLPDFIKIRKKNFDILFEEFQKYEDYFILPESVEKADPCWFAFPLTIRKSAPFKRKDLVQWLTKHNIEVKTIFSGNILKHPAYKQIKCRIIEDLKNTDYSMYNSFFVGVYPGLDEEKIKYIIETFKRFLATM